MSNGHKIQLSFSSYKGDAVIIGVSDNDAKGCMIDAAAKKLQDQSHQQNSGLPSQLSSIIKFISH